MSDIQFKISTVTGEGVKNSWLVTDAKYWFVDKPGVWDCDPMGPATCRHLDVEVVDWPDLPDEIMYTQHSHDGTLLFTYWAVSALSQFAEDHMKELGGNWVCSKVYVTHEYGEGRFSCRETAMMALRREPPQP